ncbi:MAG TPA: Ig-like domain-containing protein, partial [Trueperaceae bacterium]|nr:Ig-like domain-containing protein [Trueperaceae bacterium]
MFGPRTPPRLVLLVLIPLILVACQAADSTPPTLAGSTPANGAVDVSGTQALMLTFSEAMDKGALVVSSSPAVDLEEAEWLDAVSARVRPTSTWNYGTQHLVTIVAKDAAGNALAAGTSIGFTVEDEPDTTAPATPVGLASTPTDGGFALNWT